LTHRNCIIAALCAAAIVFCWQALTIHFNYGGNWTALFFTGDNAPVPPDLAPGTFVVRNSTGYDGQHYRYLAHDPLFTRGYSRYLDFAALRYRRILIPALAWTLALGNQRWIDAAYIFLILASVAIGVYWCARYLTLAGLPAVCGLILLLNPAALTSVDRMLLDGTLAALAAGFFLADRLGHRKLRYAVSVMAALTKETGGAFVVAAVAADLWRKQYRQALVSATAALPAAAWWSYAAFRLSSPEPTHVLEIPLLGIVRRIFTLRELPDPLLQFAFRAIDLLAVLGFAASLWLAWRWIRKDGVSATSILVGVFLLMALVLGSQNHMTDAYGYARPISPLLLFVTLRAMAAKAWRQLVPPLLVTLSILIYFAKPVMGILRGIGLCVM
jgi:hypothetical protein